MQTVTPLHKLIKLNVAILIFGKNKYLIPLILLLLGIYRPQQILYFKPTAVFNLLTSVLCVNCVWNSHSLDIPTAKHFCRRQYWQRFRVTLLIMQFLSRWHVYTMFFWMLRRKKPCRDRYIQEGRGGWGCIIKAVSHIVILTSLLIFCNCISAKTSTQLHWNPLVTGYHNVTTVRITMCWMFCFFIAINTEWKESVSQLGASNAALSWEIEYKREQTLKNLMVSKSEAACTVWKT